MSEREAMVSALAYALARAPRPQHNDTSRDYAVMLAPLVEASGYLSAEATDLPEHTRLVLVTEDLLDLIGTRAEDGSRLSYTWGEPDEHGWFTPTMHTHSDDNPLCEAIGRIAALRGANRVYSDGKVTLDADLFDEAIGADSEDER